MTQEEALEKLELEVGACQQEIERQYQEFYNEFQVRITNAPTTHQKTLYQKKLKQLEGAYTILTGKETENLDADIPWSSSGKSNKQTQRNRQKEPEGNNISKEQALKILGLNGSFSLEELNDTFTIKTLNCNQGIQAAMNKEIAEGYEKALRSIREAYSVLVSDLELQKNDLIKKKDDTKSFTDIKIKYRKNKSNFWDKYLVNADKVFYGKILSLFFVLGLIFLCVIFYFDNKIPQENGGMDNEVDFVFSVAISLMMFAGSIYNILFVNFLVTTKSIFRRIIYVISILIALTTIIIFIPLFLEFTFEVDSFIVFSILAILFTVSISIFWVFFWINLKKINSNKKQF